MTRRRARPAASPPAVGAPPPAARGRRRSARAAGFTMLELMAVMAIIGGLLLLLPPRLDGFGDRSRLESTASTLVSAFTAAREMAIIDGHETRIQFDLPGSLKDRKNPGRFRYLLAAQKREESRALAQEEGVTRDQAASRPTRPAEEEWIETEWRPLPDGVVLAGISVESGQWIRSNPRGDPLEIAFDPDGTVRPGCALQVVCVDMMSNAARTLTVLVNPLTSSAEIVEGDAELPKSRDPSDFK